MSKNDSPASSITASRFRCHRAMTAAAGKDGLVRLHFPSAPANSTRNLYAHRPLLICISGVLRNLLGDELGTAAQQQPAAKVHKATADSSPGSGAAAAATSAATKQTDALAICDLSLPVVPLPDDDPAAWEDALGIGYPLEPGVTVSWDNAKRLLLLADKFDCPTITARVRTFFNSQPKAFTATTELLSGLTVANAFDWLLTFSKCGLDDLAAVCIEYIIQHDAVPVGFPTSGLQPRHVEQLCLELQERNASLREQSNDRFLKLLDCQTQLVQARRQLKSAVDNVAVKPVEGAFCGNCSTCWYCQPHSSMPAAHCVKCGISKQRGFFTV